MNHLECLFLVRIVLKLFNESISVLKNNVLNFLFFGIKNFFEDYLEEALEELTINKTFPMIRCQFSIFILNFPSVF